MGHRTIARKSAVAGIALLTLVASATTSNAATSSPTPPVGDFGSGTIVVGGQVLGPEQGLEVVEETYVETPGPAAVGFNPPAPKGTVSPMWVEGSSYAYSVEHFQLFYTGYGRAGGNISNGKRIVRVCFWWTQGTRNSGQYCSDAAFSGGYYSPGAEAMGSFDDSLDTYAPTTYFHMTAYRIDPSL